MHAAFGDQFTVEMREFFQQPDVLQQRRTAWAGGLDVEVVGHRGAGGVGQLLHGQVLDGYSSSGAKTGADLRPRRGASTLEERQ
ncbi:hypothetical protein D3C87_1306090 [compost metagenome]